MRIHLGLILSLWSMVLTANATTRNPVGSEESVLYWRYLCENSPQFEKKINDSREISCPSQNWKIRTHLHPSLKVEVVREVIEND